jgi:hypothetical protein
MARIIGFSRIPSPSNRVHRTQVECGYATIDSDGARYIQLETYGSGDRQIPGKVSQTLQLDSDAAAQLTKLLSKTFPELGKGSG